MGSKLRFLLLRAAFPPTVVFSKLATVRQNIRVFNHDRPSVPTLGGSKFLAGRRFENHPMTPEDYPVVVGGELRWFVQTANRTDRCFAQDRFAPVIGVPAQC